MNTYWDDRARDAEKAKAIFDNQVKRIVFLLTVATACLSFFSVTKAFEKLPDWLKHLDVYLNTLAAKIVVAVLTVTAGILFYQLRKRQRLIYAGVELGAGSATAFYNAPFLISKPTQALLAIMGAIYFTVRAADYFRVWREVRKKKMS